VVQELVPQLLGSGPHVLEDVLRQLLDSKPREGIEGTLELALDELHHRGWRVCRANDHLGRDLEELGLVVAIGVQEETHSEVMPRLLRQAELEVIGLVLLAEVVVLLLWGLVVLGLPLGLLGLLLVVLGLRRRSRASSFFFRIGATGPTMISP